MEVLSGGTTSGAYYADGEACEDGLALGGEDSGEVAIADAEVAVADGDEVTGTRVVADFLDYARENGEYYIVVGGEVDAVVHRAFASEWIGAVAKG